MGTIVNIQPLDMQKRSHFQHLGENLWHGGDELDHVQTRGDEMDAGRQPLTFNIEQQDSGTWWILCDIAHDMRPLPWLRKYILCMHDIIDDLIFGPLALIHRPLPNNEEEEFRKYCDDNPPYRM